MPEKRLEKKLRAVRGQMMLAAEQKNEGAYKLLAIWEDQIISALCMKYELPPAHEKPDEIEEAISHIETMQDKAEERLQILEELNHPASVVQKATKEPSANQLNLF